MKIAINAARGRVTQINLDFGLVMLYFELV
jgi:hypothetical protein